MNGRDWVMLGSGAALSAVAVVTLYEGRAHVAAPGRQVARGHVLALQPASNDATIESRSDDVDLQPTGSPGAPTPSPGASASAQSSAASQLEHIRSKLQEVQREKRDLEAQLLTLEGELTERPSGRAGGDAAEYELDREDWKELAATGRIKYRIPCLSANGALWQTSQSELQRLGLTSEDGEPLTEAHRRSSARVWQTVRPHCVKAIGDAAIAERLGPNGCITLVQQTASTIDPMAIFNAQTQVAEVHAGIRPPPEAGHSLGPLFDIYLALTSEAQFFEADLAEHFGPEEAKRIVHALPCVATLR